MLTIDTAIRFAFNPMGIYWSDLKMKLNQMDINFPFLFEEFSNLVLLKKLGYNCCGSTVRHFSFFSASHKFYLELSDIFLFFYLHCCSAYICRVCNFYEYNNFTSPGQSDSWKTCLIIEFWNRNFNWDWFVFNLVCLSLRKI